MYTNTELAQLRKLLCSVQICFKQIKPGKQTEGPSNTLKGQRQGGVPAHRLQISTWSRHTSLSLPQFLKQLWPHKNWALGQGGRPRPGSYECPDGCVGSHYTGTFIHEIVLMLFRSNALCTAYVHAGQIKTPVRLLSGTLFCAPQGKS